MCEELEQRIGKKLEANMSKQFVCRHKTFSRHSLPIHSFSFGRLWKLRHIRAEEKKLRYLSESMKRKIVSQKEAFKSGAKAFYRVLTYQRESSHTSFNSRRKIRIPKFFFRASAFIFHSTSQKLFLCIANNIVRRLKHFRDFSIHIKQ